MRGKRSSPRFRVLAARPRGLLDAGGVSDIRSSENEQKNDWQCRARKKKVQKKERKKERKNFYTMRQQGDRVR